MWVQWVGLLEAMWRRETACEDEQEKDPEERTPHCESVHLDGHSVEIIKVRVDDFKCMIVSLGVRVQDLGLGAWWLGVEVWGSEFRVWGPRFRGQGSRLLCRLFNKVITEDEG